MELTIAQKKIASDIHRFRVLRCGRRFGKTTLAIEEMGARAWYKNNQNICYLAPTFQQARDIAWEALKKRWNNLIIKTNESRLELTFQNKALQSSRLVLRGWEAVDTLRGQRFDFLIPDEIREMRNWKMKWEQVLRPTLTDTKGDALFISTPNGYDHFYELYMNERIDPDYKSFHYTTYDNPHIPVEEIEKAKEELSEDAFWQEYMADFRKFTGLIYKEFNRDIHVIPAFNLPVTWQFYRTIDFGASNPTACLWMAVSNTDEIYVFDEYYQSEQTIKFHSSVISGKTNLNYPIIATYGDPSGKQMMLDYAEYGIIISPALRITEGNEHEWVKSGIEKVQQLLKRNNFTAKPRLYIFPNCVNLIREFESYRWLEKRQDGVDREMPLKTNDHALDALRYFIMSFQARNFNQYEEMPIIPTNPFTGYGQKDEDFVNYYGNR